MATSNPPDSTDRPAPNHAVFGRRILFAMAALFGLVYFIWPHDLPHEASRAAVGTATRDELAAAVANLDQAFRQDWASHQLSPVGAADTATLIRRLSLALTGTIPSLEELRRLEAIPEADRVSWWTDYLLADRRSSDYLAERFARVLVGTEDGPFLVFRRRRFVTWLSDQFATNVAYDELARRLIAGTGLWTDSPSVNFLTVTNDINGDEQPDEERLASRTARAFLGLRLDCVQCHDDNLGGDWLQEDFQQLAAFYSEATSSLLGIRDQPKDYEFTYLGDEETTVVTPDVPFAGELFQEGGEVAPSHRRERLAAWVTHRDNLAFRRAIVNRMWALMFGRALVMPVDDLPLKGPFPAALDVLSQDMVQHGDDLQRLIRIIARSEVFQQASRSDPAVTREQEACWAAFPVTRLRPEQVAGSLVQTASLKTIDAESHILVRLGRAEQQREFVRRYGDRGDDEFVDRGGTIPQRLLMMNGQLVRDRTKDDLIGNAITKIAALTRDDARAVENAFRTILTRRPNDAERQYFLERLAGLDGAARRRVLEDLTWALLNSSEFAWNH